MTILFLFLFCTSQHMYCTEVFPIVIAYWVTKPQFSTALVAGLSHHWQPANGSWQVLTLLR